MEARRKIVIRVDVCPCVLVCVCEPLSQLQSSHRTRVLYGCNWLIYSVWTRKRRDKKCLMKKRATNIERLFGGCVTLRYGGGSCYRASAHTAPWASIKIGTCTPNEWWLLALYENKMWKLMDKNDNVFYGCICLPAVCTTVWSPFRFELRCGS